MKMWDVYLRPTLVPHRAPLLRRDVVLRLQITAALGARGERSSSAAARRRRPLLNKEGGECVRAGTDHLSESAALTCTQRQLITTS